MAATPRYRAKQQISFDGVLAYMPGDEVPADNVTRNDWGKLVERVPEGEPISNPEPDADTTKR